MPLIPGMGGLADELREELRAQRELLERIADALDDIALEVCGPLPADTAPAGQEAPTAED